MRIKKTVIGADIILRFCRPGPLSIGNRRRACKPESKAVRKETVLGSKTGLKALPQHNGLEDQRLAQNLQVQEARRFEKEIILSVCIRP
jgi:hypothetical protein